MNRVIEIAINIIFWVLSIGISTQIFSVNIVEVDIQVFNGHQIERETITDLSQWFYIGTIWKVLLFYLIVFFLIPRFFGSPQYLRFASFLLSSMFLALSLEILPLYLLQEGVNASYFSTAVIMLGFYTSTAFTYGIIRNQIQKERYSQVITNKRLQTELKLLRSQINPHFLFNALNNLLSISERSGDSKVSAGITELSDMLRFLIYETQTDWTALKKEVEFLESYIALQTLRFAEEDDIEITFEVQGIESQHQIAPALLIPLVENAFKHGVRYNVPSFVQISLEIKDHHLTFDLQNSKHPPNTNEFDQQYVGIGLENVSKRLNLIYPKKHQFKINEQENTFVVHLQLQLQKGTHF